MAIELSERVARFRRPDSVDRTWIASDAPQFGLQGPRHDAQFALRIGTDFDLTFCLICGGSTATTDFDSAGGGLIASTGGDARLRRDRSLAATWRCGACCRGCATSAGCAWAVPAEPEKPSAPAAPAARSELRHAPPSRAASARGLRRTRTCEPTGRNPTPLWCRHARRIRNPGADRSQPVPVPMARPAARRSRA